MAHFQRGILAEANLHSLYLMFKATPGCEAELRHHLACFQGVVNSYAHQYSEAELSAFVAVGADYWDKLYPDARPALLRPFPTQMDYENRVAPHTPYDLFVHIRCDRADVNHLVGNHICHLFAESVELQEQVKGFRYLDGRDLTGFVDGTENPHGAHRRAVALVDEQVDFEFAGGSYIHVQRYRHLMASWNELPTKSQEEIIGRTKADDIEYPSAEKKSFAHTKRTNLKDSEGKSIEILRQSMPYGTMKVQGLYFISCCHSPAPFELMLASMIGKNSAHYDHLLKYTRAETGAAFFAPPVDFLKQYI